MKVVAICPNIIKDPDLFGAVRVINALRGKVSLMMQSELLEKISEAYGAHLCDDITFADDDIFFAKPDVMIVLGGDGSILKAARKCAQSGVPILGINQGRVGYMAELELDELSMLDRIVSGDYRVENRMMLEADVGNERLFALNEAVLGGASVFRIVEIELYCDGNLVSRYRADGLIASTPTGSTAYSMSAGGAIVDPRMEALLITPICSHSLSATPLVFSARSELTMKNVTMREDALYLNIDGSEERTLLYGESVTFRRCARTVGFIRLKDGGFYDVLHRKMSE